MKIITKNIDYNYNLYDIEYIKDNQEEFIKDADLAQLRFNYNFPNFSSTKLYRYYNFFNLTVGSLHYYNLLSDIKDIVRDYANTQDPLWLQSWINYHKFNEILDWHQHTDSTFHGYVSIDPKDTKTVFTNYEVVNKVGKVYIGQSYVPHKVVALSDFESPRITLGFDIFDITAMNKMYTNYGAIDVNIGMIPI
jgi:hypothetical protein